MRTAAERRSAGTACIAFALGAAAVLSLPAPAAAWQSAYSLDQVVNFLKGGMDSNRVLNLVKTNCRAFSVDSNAARELRAAGAESLFVQGLREACERLPSVTGAPTNPGTTPAGLAAGATLTVGREVQGSLDSDDVMIDRYRVDQYTFTAAAGERLAIDLRSSAFDAYLSVGRLVAGSYVEIVANDDGGTGTDARIVFSPSEAGQYVARVRGFSTDASGAYRLSLEPHRELPVQTHRIAMGDRMHGTIDQTDAALDDGTYYEHWVFSAEAGETFEINVSSTDFDTFISLGRMSGGTFDELEWDDDGGEDTDSRIASWSAPSAGEFVIRVRPFSSGSTGTYTISLGAAMEVTRAVPAFEATGTISASSRRLPDGTPYQDWPLTLQAGERYSFALESTAFDTFLSLGQMRGDEYVELQQDDDGGGGTNSLLYFTVTATGDYVLRVRPFSSDGAGDYWWGAYKHAESYSVIIGRELNGTLTTADVQFDDESYFEEWTFSARANQRFTIVMRSDAFDAYLVLGRNENGGFVEIDSDDDGDGGTNARIEFTAGQAGEYVIRATSFEGGQTGAYTLRVTAQ